MSSELIALGSPNMANRNFSGVNIIHHLGFSGRVRRPTSSRNSSFPKNPLHLTLLSLKVPCLPSRRRPASPRLNMGRFRTSVRVVHLPLRRLDSVKPGSSEPVNPSPRSPMPNRPALRSFYDFMPCSLMIGIPHAVSRSCVQKRVDILAYTIVRR